MSFDPAVPKANQSPGVFPAQNNTNFRRLKEIIENDHVFNDTQNVDTDGVHKQCTMIARDIPEGDLPDGTSAILYTFVDSNSQPQLGYYNGTNTFELTPITSTAPTMITGIVTIPAGGDSPVIYTFPVTTFITIMIAVVNAGPIGNVLNHRYYGVLRGTGTVNSFLISGSSTVDLVINGNDIYIHNPSNAAFNVSYFIVSESA